MQNVHFRQVEEFLDFLPVDELKVTLYLRSIILDCMPHCVEKLAYNVPYYYINKSICFLWPGAVFWGKKRSYLGVRFGFTKGYLLTDPEGLLIKGNRKHVYWCDFSNINEIDEEAIRALIFEAMYIDEEKQ